MAKLRSRVTGLDQDQGQGGMGGESPISQFDPTKIGPAAANEAPGFGMQEPGGDVVRKIPIGASTEGAQSGETPRDRGMVQATLKRPSTPTPMAGSVMSPPPPPAPMPFSPLGSPDVGIMAKAKSSIFGSQGGLQGGGFGLPLDPTSNQDSPSIEGLLQLLMGKKGL